MQGPLPGDLDYAVRALLPLPMALWPAAAAHLVAGARLGGAYRARIGRAHPAFGTGSLMSAAARWPMDPLPETCDRTYRAAMRAVLDAVDADGGG